MIPSKKEIDILLKKYAPNEKYLELVRTHGIIVSEIALDCAKNTYESVNIEVLEAACLLHDIGSYVFVGANNYSSDFRDNYPGHALFGAKILQDEGIDERICEAIETHVLLGLTAGEIKESGKKLPYKNYEPKTIEGRLLCYADRFHSKRPIFNSYENFHEGMKQNFPLQAKKLEEWSEEFSIPDVEYLAKKYNHPVK